MRRIEKIKRITNETEIEIRLNIDGRGKYNIDTPIGFLNHMLELFAKNGMFDLDIRATGDMKVDEHHLVEDVGIVLGSVFAKALGEKRGINRYGFFILPMDEVLATAVLDFCGRFFFKFDCIFGRKKVGDLPTELIYDFWDSFAQNARMNLQIKVENGRNTHHKVEAIFKSVARACRMACQLDEKLKNNIPTTKGVL